MGKKEYKFRYKENNEWMYFTLDCLSNISWTTDIPFYDYIGRKDVNGKEIYVGDIVTSKEYRNRKWLVTYIDNGNYIGYLPKEIKDGRINHYISWDDMEIIGNIIDNKELSKPRLWLK